MLPSSTYPTVFECQRGRSALVGANEFVLARVGASHRRENPMLDKTYERLVPRGLGFSRASHRGARSERPSEIGGHLYVGHADAGVDRKETDAR